MHLSLTYSFDFKLSYIQRYCLNRETTTTYNNKILTKVSTIKIFLLPFSGANDFFCFLYSYFFSLKKKPRK